MTIYRCDYNEGRLYTYLTHVQKAISCDRYVMQPTIDINSIFNFYHGSFLPKGQLNLFYSDYRGKAHINLYISIIDLKNLNASILMMRINVFNTGKLSS